MPYGILLPASILTTGWYQALCLWVGFNTLVFATLSLMQLFPPLRLGSRLHRSSPKVTSSQDGRVPQDRPRAWCAAETPSGRSS